MNLVCLQAFVLPIEAVLKVPVGFLVDRCKPDWRALLQEFLELLLPHRFESEDVGSNMKTDTPSGGEAKPISEFNPHILRTT